MAFSSTCALLCAPRASIASWWWLDIQFITTHSIHDAVAEAYARVFLVDAGYATQREVAAAFGCAERTVRRDQQRYHDGGMAALGARSGWRAGRRRVPTKRLRIIEGLQARGA